MVWIHDIIEVDSVFMNPMRPEKLLRLLKQLRLGSQSRVLEVGAGRCGPAIMLAHEFGCTVTAVEPHQPFIDDGRERARSAGMADRITFVESDGRSFEIEPGRYDAALCLGATFAYDGLEGTLDALAPGVRPGGHVVTGEPYRHSAAETPHYAMHPWTLGEICERFAERDLPVAWLARSSVDEWDEYTSVHTKDLLDWLEQNPDSPDADEVRDWHRSQVAGFDEGYMGWAVVAGRRALR